jgi:HEAT repeat protein
MNAANVLSALGPEAAATIPLLARVLKGTDEEMIGWAARALNCTEPASRPVVREALEHGSASARSALLLSMVWRIGDDDGPAPDAEVALVVEALIKGCHDPDPKVRCGAARSIMSCRGNTPRMPLFASVLGELVRLLSDRDSEVRIHAMNTVLFDTEFVTSSSRLIELLDDPSPGLRSGAALALSQVDHSEKRSAGRLREMLYDPDPKCREQAAETLRIFDLPLASE